MTSSRFEYNTKNCVRENSLWLSGYGICFWCTRSLVRILPGPYISAMHLFIYFFVKDFVHKTGARPGLAIEPIIPSVVQKWTFCLTRLSVINKWWLRRGVLREITPQAWLLPDLNTIPDNYVRENSHWLSGYGIGFWYTRSLVWILPGPYFSAMHLFICFFVRDFVRNTCRCREKTLQKTRWPVVIDEHLVKLCAAGSCRSSTSKS